MSTVGRVRGKPAVIRLVAGLCLLAAAVPGEAGARPPGLSKVSAAAEGGQVVVSGWATFSGGYVAARSDSATNAAPGADVSGGELIRTELTYRPELADLFVRWELKSLPTVAAGVVGDPSVLYGLRTVIAGVPVDIRAQSAGASALFGLFDCASETGCTKLADLAGGFGTSGVEVVVAVPLSVLASYKLVLREGDKIGAPTAYTARAAYLAGAVADAQRLDSIVLVSTATATVPARSVRLTIGQTSRVATLTNGSFKASFPSADVRTNPVKVTSRTCLGAACVVQTISVKF
jgi:hypothetical protein